MRLQYKNCKCKWCPSIIFVAKETKRQYFPLHNKMCVCVTETWSKLGEREWKWNPYSFQCYFISSGVSCSQIMIPFKFLMQITHRWKYSEWLFLGSQVKLTEFHRKLKIDGLIDLKVAVKVYVWILTNDGHTCLSNSCAITNMKCPHWKGTVLIIFSSTRLRK